MVDYTPKRGSDGMTRAERKAHVQRIRDEKRGGLTVKAYNALHGILTKKERKAVNAAHDEHRAMTQPKESKAAVLFGSLGPRDPWGVRRRRRD